MDNLLAILREIALKKFTPAISVGTATAITTYLTVKFLLDAINSFPLLNQIAAVAGLSFLIALGILGIWHYSSYVLYSRQKWEAENEILQRTGAYPPLPAGNNVIIPRLAENTYRNSSHKSRLGTLFLIALIVAVVIAGLLFYQHQIQIHAHIPTISAAPVNPTTPINPYPIYFQKYGTGTSVIDDPLNQSSRSSWQTAPNWCRFVGQTYHVGTFAGKDLNAWYGPKTRFKNFTYEVDMTILKGRCGGLLFRKVSTSNEYYVFQVCQDRTYALLKYVGDAGINFQAFFGVTKDNREIIPGSGHMNKIAVVAKGSTLYLFVHTVQVAEIHDASYTEGNIALVASSDLYNDTTEVSYQNAKVWIN